MTTRKSKKAVPKRGAKSKAPAKAKAPAPVTPPVAPATEPRPRDPRLPRPGGILTRTFNGKEIKVEVLDAGFRHDGKVWRSLSGIAKAVSGTPWNGFLFFGLQKRPAKSATPEKATPATKAASAATAEAK
jgi:hypothetical protein